jgi:hypothetical protein
MKNFFKFQFQSTAPHTNEPVQRTCDGCDLYEFDICVWDHNNSTAFILLENCLWGYWTPVNVEADVVVITRP